MLFQAIDLAWPDDRQASRPSISFPTDNSRFTVVGSSRSTGRKVIALGASASSITIGTGAFLQILKLGTAMRAMANDQERSPRRSASPSAGSEAAAWLGCGLLSGIAGIMLADLSALDDTTLVFTVVISSLAAALIGRLRSISVTFVAAIVIGLVHDLITPITQLTNYQDMTPFVLATIALLVMSRRQVMTSSREEG